MNKELLNNELAGNEFELLELSNKLMELGFYDLFDNGNLIEILESGCIVIYHKDGDEYILNFNVIEFAEDDTELYTTLKVTSVDNF